MKKSSMTISDINYTDSERMNKSSTCAVELINTYHTIEKETLDPKFQSETFTRTMINVSYVIFKFKVTSTKPYEVLVKLNPDFDLVEWSNNNIQIYCQCADFKYRSAYVLNKKNTLLLTDRIKLTLGLALVDAPKSNSKTTLLCKHAYAALNWLMSNYSVIMKSI